MSESKPKKQKASYKTLLNQIKKNEKSETKTDNKIIEIFSDETELRKKGLGGGNFNKIDKI